MTGTQDLLTLSALVVREARSEDIVAIAELRARVSMETYASFDRAAVAAWVSHRQGEEAVRNEGFGQHTSQMLVATDAAGEIVGSSYMKIGPQPHASDAYFGGLYLRRDARGIGLGPLLLRDQLAWAGKMGAKRVLTETEGRNARAHSMFERAGFVDRIVTPWDHRVPGMSWIEMTLDLP